MVHFVRRQCMHVMSGLEDKSKTLKSALGASPTKVGSAYGRTRSQARNRIQVRDVNKPFKDKHRARFRDIAIHTPKHHSRGQVLNVNKRSKDKSRDRLR